jgi:hypothetical protein
MTDTSANIEQLTEDLATVKRGQENLARSLEAIHTDLRIAIRDARLALVGLIIVVACVAVLSWVIFLHPGVVAAGAGGLR